MFKKILVFILIAVSFVWGVMVWAQPDIGLGTAGGIAKQGGLSAVGVNDLTLAQTIGRFVNIALSFTGFIFLILTLYAGYLWMFGGGNEENISKAKEIFTSSIIGLVIVLSAFSITALVMYFIVGTAAPEPYGKVLPTGPSEDTGCCYRQSDESCWQNIGVKRCTDEGGKQYDSACSLMMNDFGYKCNYKL